MDKITNITALKNPNFVKPISIEYTQNNKNKIWEAVITHNSVSILLWNKESDAFVLVKQLRPPVLNAHPQNGYMYELCAGIVDKELSLEQIAKEEVFEECGYEIPLQSLEKITSFYTCVGISGAKQTLYFAVVDDAMQVNEGGGLADEEIEVIYLPTKEAKEFIFDESYQKTPGMVMAFYWFFDNKKALMQTQ